MLIAALSLLTVAADVPTLDLLPAARVAHPAIAEQSGIVPSARYPGTFWVHNDSGDEPRIFAIRADGTSAQRAEAGIRILGATNVDWEEITRGGDTLYICDVGNNGNARRDLGVYALPEPNPNEVDSARFLAFYPVRYADQTEFPPTTMHFDCEAVFAHDRRLYFITKHRQNQLAPAVSANLYVMETFHTDRPNVLRRVDSRSNLGGWVTGAALSPNGRTLAVLTQSPTASVWLFDAPRMGDRWLSGRARQLVLRNAKQAEAITWENAQSLLVTNEQREIFRVPLSAWGR